MTIQLQKNNEKIIEGQKAQLYEASKLSSIGEMASGFAHEINNPLAIINGRIQMTQKEIKKNEMNKTLALANLEICRETIKRISKIISGLQNLSHSGNAEAELITIQNLIEDTITMVNLKINEKGIDFRINFFSVENAEIFCNSIQINQVLINLLSNAIYEIQNQEKPWISLKIILIDFEYKFSVMDSGTGIPMEVQKKIFEPMFTTKPIRKGTGLGLSICKSIIEKHHGKLIINNDSPNTYFEIYLPQGSNKRANTEIKGRSSERERIFSSKFNDE